MLWNEKNESNLSCKNCFMKWIHKLCSNFWIRCLFQVWKGIKLEKWASIFKPMLNGNWCWMRRVTYDLIFTIINHQKKFQPLLSRNLLVAVPQSNFIGWQTFRFLSKLTTHIEKYFPTSNQKAREKRRIIRSRVYLILKAPGKYFRRHRILRWCQ